MGKRIKKKGKVIIGIVVLILLGVFIVYKVRSRDAPPPDDQDLAVVFSDVPDEENALTYFKRAASILLADDKETELFTEQLSTKRYDPEFSREFIEKRDEGFQVFKQGLERTRFEVPKLDFDPLRLNPIHRELRSQWRSIARVESTRALHSFKQGREKEALEIATDIIRFGQMIENCREPLTTYLVGEAVMLIGLSRFSQIITETELRPEELKPYVQRLEQFQGNEEGLINTFKVEYHVYCDLIDFSTQRRSPYRKARVGYTFKPNETKRLFAKTCRALIENVPRHLSEMSRIETQVRGALPVRIRYYVQPNFAGRIMVELTIPASELMLLRKCKENVLISATQLLVALKCYKLDYGQLPETLDELVPEFIDRMPIDDFDGKPLRYSKEKKIIYSVGSDLKDDGGPTVEEIDKHRDSRQIQTFHEDPWLSVGF